MNKLFIVGNLVRDPELRTVASNISVCSFTVAVNRRRSNNAEAGQPEADFFRVTAWRQLGENCNRYLSKGKKVAVVGSVSVSNYQTANGETRSSLEVTADDVEFLSPKSETSGSTNVSGSTPSGYEDVSDDTLPF